MKHRQRNEAREALRLVESGKNWWHGAIASASGPAFESHCKAAESADEKPDGQAENVTEHPTAEAP